MLIAKIRGQNTPLILTLFPYWICYSNGREKGIEVRINGIWVINHPSLPIFPSTYLSPSQLTLHLIPHCLIIQNNGN
tara:strand:+ start:1011 stop:1241 length:231 start_codon:yes stop_codon:yes gene_type:complete